MDQTWTARELPVLEVIVEYFDDHPDASHLLLQQIAAATGIDDLSVGKALVALATADPTFIEPVEVDQRVPIGVSGVTERARVAVGQWPSPEGLISDLVKALDRAAETEPDPERKSKLRTVAAVLGGIAREVAVSWASGALPHP
jgi:hypothetical protein